MSSTVSALQNKKFRWLFAGNTAMYFSISSRMMITSLLSWQLTHQETSLALINIALAAPMFIGALVAGAIADRVERKQLILLGLSAVLLAESSVFVALVLGKLTFLHLLVATFICGCGHPFIMPASTIVMYQLLGRSQIGNGVALMSGAMNLSRVLGPSITGALAAWFDNMIAFGGIVLLSAVAFCCQSQVPVSRPQVDPLIPINRDIINGVRHLFRSRIIAVCLFFGLLPVLLAMSVQYFLVILTDQVWMVGAKGLGILLGVMGIGGFIGSTVAGRWINSIGKLKMMVFSTLFSALLFACFGLSNSFYTAAVLLGLANMFMVVSQVVNHVAIQLLVSEEMRGRVSGYILMSFSMGPLAIVPLAFLVEKLGPQIALMLASIVVIILSLLSYLCSEKLRNLDRYIIARGGL